MKIEWEKEYRKSVYKLVKGKYWQEGIFFIAKLAIWFEFCNIIIAAVLYINLSLSLLPPGLTVNRQWWCVMKAIFVPVKLVELVAVFLLFFKWLVLWRKEPGRNLYRGGSWRTYGSNSAS